MLRLVIFDVDGTLVDSQHHIWASMEYAYRAVGLPAPARDDVLGMVGLSLPQLFARLAADHPLQTQAALADAYKTGFAELRAAGAIQSALYPGAREALDMLTADPHTLLAVATGKSRRGLDAVIEAHGLHGVFVSQQVADFHPSKPHPSMIESCLRDTGVAPRRAVMVGDTAFDMQMARAAGVGAIGVGWGYHRAGDLGADVVIDAFGALGPALNDLLEARV